MEAFDRRRKALTYWGNIEVEVVDRAEYEWVRIAQTPAGSRPRHMLDVSDSFIATYFVISSSRATGGRTLMAVREMQLVHNPKRIVEVYKKCIESMHSAAPGEVSLELKDEIRKLWSTVSISISN